MYISEHAGGLSSALAIVYARRTMKLIVTNQGYQDNRRPLDKLPGFLTAGLEVVRSRLPVL